MVYQPRKNNYWPPRLLLLVLFLLALLFFFFGPFFLPRLASLALTVSRPLWLGRSAFLERLQDLPARLQDKEKLDAENRRLREEISRLHNQLLVLARLAEEAELLKKMLGRDGEAVPPLAAAVVKTPPQTPYDLVVVDLGRKNSRREFRVGDLVAVGPVVLGRVAEIGDRLSKVQLFSSPASKLDVVLGKGQLPAQLTGRGGGNFRALLPRGLPVAVGEAAWFREAGGEWLLAVVGGVEGDERSSLQTIFLRTPVNLQQLKYVAIYPQAD